MEQAPPRGRAPTPGQGSGRPPGSPPGPRLPVSEPETQLANSQQAARAAVDERRLQALKIRESARALSAGRGGRPASAPLPASEAIPDPPQGRGVPSPPKASLPAVPRCPHSSSLSARLSASREAGSPEQKRCLCFFPFLRGQCPARGRSLVHSPQLCDMPPPAQWLETHRVWPGSWASARGLPGHSQGVAPEAPGCQWGCARTRGSAGEGVGWGWFPVGAGLRASGSRWLSACGPPSGATPLVKAEGEREAASKTGPGARVTGAQR